LIRISDDAHQKQYDIFINNDNNSTISTINIFIYLQSLKITNKK